LDDAIRSDGEQHCA